MINYSSLSLAGKRALITGGGTGIGYAIAEAFVASGADIIISGRRPEVLDEAVKNLGPKARAHSFDITDLNCLPGVISSIESQSGPIDILVNNAGTNMKKSATDVTDDEFSAVMKTNVSGVFALTREAARGMIERRNGVILNITSMAALYGIPKVPAYSAAKTAVLGLTRQLAVEFGPSGIRVNAIAPGFIYSAMTDKALNADPERKARVMARTPMGRMGQPSEVGSVAVFLCSDAASFVTGACLPVDGGNSIGF